MYFKSIHIKKYRMLENLTLNFQAPRTPTEGDNGNVVNVIAGGNGTGKTSLFEGIKHFSTHPYTPNSSEVIDFALDENTQEEYSQENYNFPNHKNSVFKIGQIINHGIATKGYLSNNLPKLIYLSAQVDFAYKETNKLSQNYQFINIVNKAALLGNAEYYIREFILSHERSSHESNPKNRTQIAIKKFNQIFEKTDLLTRLHDLDPQQFNRPIFKNSHGDIVTIDQLSDGEKQLYGRVVSLMILNPKDSIILIDEPEIALHPAWQQMIMRIYASIGENNQFIVATHSPHIIADTPPENLIFLRKNPDTQQIEAIHQNAPPAGVDVNSILREFMGIEALPREQLELHRQYRQFIEEGKEDSEQAINVKQQILKKENINSEFMQEMEFLQQLREA